MKQANEDAETLIAISKDIEKYGCCVIKNYLKMILWMIDKVMLQRIVFRHSHLCIGSKS